MLLQRGAAAARDEGRRIVACLRDWRLGSALALLAMLICLAAQAPLSYSFDVGLEQGVGSDLPMLADFFAPERIHDTTTRLRWTDGHSLIRLPDIGQRPLQVSIRLLPVSSEAARRGPRTLDIWAGGRPLAQIALRPATGGVYDVLVPAAPNGSGDQQIELRSATFHATGDRRAIGVPVDEVDVSGAAGPKLPAWPPLLEWLGALVMFWLGLRRAEVPPGRSQVVVGAAALLAGVSAVLDAPRFAFGADVALVTAALGWLMVVLLTAAPAGLVLAGLILAPIGTASLALGLGAADWGGLGPALLCVAAALLLAGGLRPPLERLYRRVAPPIPAIARQWLLLFALLVLVSHFGGKIYPDSMEGDIGFHSHRFTDVSQGRVYMLSSNRGVDFPYPPALYLLLQPLSLTGIDERPLLQFAGALFDALSPFLIYTIVVCAGAIGRPESSSEKPPLRYAPRAAQHAVLPALALRRAEPEPPAQDKHGDVPRVEPDSAAVRAGEFPTVARAALSRWGVLAGGCYALMAATMMTTWWNFSSHIFSQFAHLLLIAALVALWGRVADTRRPTKDERPKTNGTRSLSCLVRPWSFVLDRWSFVALVVLQIFVYTGHFGFWINMSLLGAIGLAALLIGALRGRIAWGVFRFFLAAYAASEAFAVLFYYSAYAGLFVDQIQIAATSGLPGLAERQAVDRGLIWRALWEAGFRTHFGLFPVPLAVCGLLLLWRRTIDDRRPTAGGQSPRSVAGGRWPAVVAPPALAVLIAGTFAVALLFGGLPFLTGSTQATRWLMFSAWTIAVAGTLAAQLLWRSGRAGRWLSVAMGGYVFWITASMWLGALAWRIRPPEPF